MAYNVDDFEEIKGLQDYHTVEAQFVASWLGVRDNEIETLRAKLAEVEQERVSIHKHRSIIFEDLERVRAERDEARRWASAWKRSAKMWRIGALFSGAVIAGYNGGIPFTHGGEYKGQRFTMPDTNQSEDDWQMPMSDKWAKFVNSMTKAEYVKRASVSGPFWIHQQTGIVYPYYLDHVKGKDWHQWLEAGQTPPPF